MTDELDDGLSLARPDAEGDADSAAGMDAVQGEGVRHTPTPNVCQVCGRSPARWFTVQRNVGMLFQRKLYKWEGWRCRPHARQLVAAWLLRTIIQGWWGVISAWVNIFVVLADLNELARALFMPKPQPN